MYLPQKHVTVCSLGQFGWAIDPSMCWASGNKVAILTLRSQLYPQPLKSLATLLHFWYSSITPTPQHFIKWKDCSKLELILLGFSWLFYLILPGSTDLPSNLSNAPGTSGKHIQGLGKVTADISFWLRNSSIFTHPLILDAVNLYQHSTHGLYSSSRFLHLSPFAIRFVKFDSCLWDCLTSSDFGPIRTLLLESPYWFQHQNLAFFYNPIPSFPTGIIM